ncbi:MAG: methionine adenosyltransferase domain-containing protein, partial [Halothiobacillaceae bacterium]
IGGGALTGKDHHKPDRRGARIAREVALAAVRTGVADEATVTAVTLPGDEAPRVLRIATPRGGLAQPQRWVGAFGAFLLA